MGDHGGGLIQVKAFFEVAGSFILEILCPNLLISATVGIQIWCLDELEYLEINSRERWTDSCYISFSAHAIRQRTLQIERVRLPAGLEIHHDL
jgi:hypothetical protein